MKFLRLIPAVVLLYFLYASTFHNWQLKGENGEASVRVLGRPGPKSTLVLRTRVVVKGRGQGALSPVSLGAPNSAAATAALAVAGAQREESPPLPPLPAPAPAPPQARAAASLHAARLSSPRALRPVRELLPELHPLYPYPSTQEFSVALATGWFTGDMPYFTGAHTCPASGCRIALHNRGRSDPSAADMVLYHLRPGDWEADNTAIAPPSKGGRQLVGFMLAEGFDAASRPPELYAKFNSEHSFRASSLVRDSYILWFLNDAHKQGIAHPQRPLTMEARVWEDIWEPPLPLQKRSLQHQASWGSHYCRGARSGREDLVRALLKEGLSIAIYGEEGNCLRNVGGSVLAMDRGSQFGLMREHKFYLAFENHRLEGYVSEKVRLAAACRTETGPFARGLPLRYLLLPLLLRGSLNTPSTTPLHFFFPTPCAAVLLGAVAGPGSSGVGCPRH